MLHVRIKSKQIRSLAPPELVLGLDLRLVARIVGQVLQVVREMLFADVGPLPRPGARQYDVVPGVGHLQVVEAILKVASS